MSHRVLEDWMGEPVETLADLIPPNPRAICVGINPAPTSVEVGHYYQGQLGQRFLGRLRQVGLLPSVVDGWEDDAAYALGIGFTDIVKRPTTSAGEVTSRELRYGTELLESKLLAHRAPLVIFTFKKAAQQVFGSFEGNGFVPGLAPAKSKAFVLPGPMESRERAERTLETLRRQIARSP